MTHKEQNDLEMADIEKSTQTIGITYWAVDLFAIGALVLLWVKA